MGKEEIDSASIAAFLRTAKDVNMAQLSQVLIRSDINSLNIKLDLGSSL